MPNAWTKVKPAWDVWRHIPNPKISELVALSMDFEPNPDYIERRLMDDHEFHAEWKKRSFIAIHNLGVELHAVIGVTDSQSEDPCVNFGEFAKWALSLKWKVPPEFAERTTEGGNVEPVDKPLADSERKSLLKLVLGMAIAGYEYDPKKRQEGKRQTAIREICDDLQRLGLGLSDQTIGNYLQEAMEKTPPTEREDS